MGPLSVAAAAVVAIWWGASPWVVAGGAVMLWYPWPALAALSVWVTIERLRGADRVTPDDEARFLEAVATELHGGATPRLAIVRAVDAEPAVPAGPAGRIARLGLDGDRIARALGDALPLNGRLAGAAWALAHEAGGPLGPVMRLLALRAAERGRLARDQRVLTAQARATAWLIAGLPLALFAVLAATGRIAAGPALPVALAGAGLQVIGVSIAVVMLRSGA